MEFIFICPNKAQTFKGTNFRIIDNRGIKKDAWGNKVLDAKIELLDACPFCSDFHTYHASELVCPFEISGDSASETNINDNA